MHGCPAPYISIVQERNFLQRGDLQARRASQVAPLVNNLPASAGEYETHVQSLGQEDPLEKGTATHSSILA